jgi:Na+/melibiose symporter-like transporter
MISSIKKIILPLIIIIIGFVAYSIFFKKDESTSLLKKEVATSSDVLGADIIRAINQISSLELRRDVFNDPIFKTLVDRSEEIKPEPVGRQNPFAPIGAVSDASNATTTTRTSTSTVITR